LRVVFGKITAALPGGCFTQRINWIRFIFHHGAIIQEQGYEVK